MKNLKLINYSISLVIIMSVLFISCSKKDTTDSTKKDNSTQTTTTNTTNMNTTKSDTLKTKSNDTTQLKDSGDETNTVVMETSEGTMTIELYEKDAPLHVANFKKLVKSKFYEGCQFHRVIPNFMIQAGDPNTKGDDKSTYGIGGPGYTIPAEIKLKHEKGSLAAARMGDDVNPKRESSGSQFYIVTGNASHLDGQYSVYGKVIKGYDVAEKIQNVKRDARDCPLEKVAIKKVYFAK
jgi:cyclophilin family peptidyl-prolyl cis-trans isomerase